MAGLTILGYISIAVLAIGVIYRAIKIKSMPVHLRWELSPVPHEKGRSKWGGSYLEEFEWWKKPREKSLINEALYMFKEIVFLKGVWEKNRPLWIFSFPFHFGLYLLFGVVGLSVINAVLMLVNANAQNIDAGIVQIVLGLTSAIAAISYLLGTFGTVGLFFKRIFDENLRPFNSFNSFFNLIFCIVMTYIIALLPNTDKQVLSFLIKICEIAFGVFGVTWTAIFGSGAIKKWKGLK